MAGYDLKGLIRETVEESGLSDPGEIAAKVAELVPAQLLRPVLAVVLREYVRTLLHSYERWGSPSPADETGPRQPNRSAKVTAIRAWARVLRKPVAVEGNVWKQFGQCGTEDLIFLALDRRENAAESIAAAERFERYAAALKSQDVELVADLPDDVIATLEGGGHHLWAS